jgi:hypothetical protein
MEVNMNDKRIRPRGFLLGSATSVVLILVFLFATGTVFSHGGKEHASSFTALQALQKATELYDKLIDSSRLPGFWETDLERIDIANRLKDGHKEYIVSFQRSGEGGPNTVYIYFNAEGEYAGSNFTGK